MAKSFPGETRVAIIGGGIIVVAALVTPPDMISPFLLAVPIYGLYEVSIWCVRFLQSRRRDDEGQDDESRDLTTT